MDGKFYVGTKKRSTTVPDFDHSSFFAGGKIKSAGTLYVDNGKITLIRDLAGAYFLLLIIPNIEHLLCNATSAISQYLCPYNIEWGFGKV